MDNIIPGIYCIQSKSHPERIYMGSSVDIEKRWGTHLRFLKIGKHHSKKLQFHYNKYGKDDLEFWIYEICINNENLIDREQFYIDILEPCFNMAKIANITRGGWKHTKESLDKMSKAKMGKKRPPMKEETREKLRQAQIAYLSIEENKDARTAAANKAWEDKRNGVFIKTRINGRKPKNKAL